MQILMQVTLWLLPRKMVRTVAGGVEVGRAGELLFQLLRESDATIISWTRNNVLRQKYSDMAARVSGDYGVHATAADAPLRPRCAVHELETGRRRREVSGHLREGQ